MSDYELHHGDMLEVMPTLGKGSVQFVFADFPYATKGRQVTANAWDKVINLNQFWIQSNQVRSGNAVTAMTATQPFASELIVSNTSAFRYDIILDKHRPSRFLHAKRMPLLRHEHILLFYTPPACYHPQMTLRRKPQKIGGIRVDSSNWSTPNRSRLDKEKIYTHSYPTTIQVFKRDACSFHPTQKPVALLEWLIATYTNKNDVVLDPCFGSGTTGVACANLGRNFIGIEKDATYFAAGKARIEKAYAEAAAGPVQSRLTI